MRRIGSLVTLLWFVMAVTQAWAHGVVGDYVFLEPLIAEDPTPANEFDVIEPNWTKSAGARTFALGSSIEKVIGAGDAGDAWVPRWSIGAGSAWNYESPERGTNLSGFGEVQLFLKYACWVVPEHEFLMGAMVDLAVPAGNSAFEAQSHASVGPELLWEKGLGDLPDWPIVKFLRPLGFQGDFGYLPALAGPASHLLFADQVIEYSLMYLSNSVYDLGLKWPLRNVFLFTEINYSQLVAGPAGQVFPTLLATPGIAYVGYRFELSVGTQFALNRASIPGTHAAVIALLDIFYDSIIAQGNWTLFGGGHP